MDAQTIKEARRLIHDLIFNGEAILRTGTVVHPKHEVLVLLWEKIATKKLEEPIEATTVEGFTPQQTYREREKDRHEVLPDGPPLIEFGPEAQAH